MGQTLRRRAFGILVGITSLAAVAACSDPTSTTPIDPLAGLEEAARTDTGTPVNPPPQQPTGPGYFRGTVMGLVPGPGVDTLASAIRLPGVIVSAHPRTAYQTGPEFGTAVASVATDAQGEFVLPTLPGGEYAITFRPPSDSPYVGGWSIGTASPTSGDRPWFIMLPRR